MTQYVSLKDLCRDPRLQSRAAGIDEQHVAEIIVAIEARKPIDPIKFCKDLTGKYCYDGWHRVAAFEHKGYADVPCVYESGSLEEAIERGAAANQSHGLKRTNADKRRAVEMLLALQGWAEKSDRVIAEHVGVGHPFVAAVRSNQLESDSSCHPGQARRTGRDGKKRRAKMQKRKPEVEPVRPANGTEGPAEQADEHAESISPLCALAKRLDEQYTSLKALASDLSRLVTSGGEKLRGPGDVIGRINDAAISCKSAAANLRDATPLVPAQCTACNGSRNCVGEGRRSTGELRLASSPPSNWPKCDCEQLPNLSVRTRRFQDLQSHNRDCSSDCKPMCQADAADSGVSSLSPSRLSPTRPSKG